MRFIGAALTLSGLSVYAQNLFLNYGGPHFFWTTAGAIIALFGFWLLLESAPKDQRH